MDNDTIEQLIAAAKAGVYLGGEDIRRLVAHYEGTIERIRTVLNAQADGVPE